jgi:hypothetical protein
MRRKLTARSILLGLAALLLGCAFFLGEQSLASRTLNGTALLSLAVALALIVLAVFSPTAGRLRDHYKSIALFVFNTAIVLLGINLILGIVFGIVDHFRVSANAVVFANRDQAYPNLKTSQVTALLEETYSRPEVFEPFIQFKEPTGHGDYVNVTEDGFRTNGEKPPLPWPPASARINIFVFGGSTTFGYGLPDNETLPAHLEQSLNHGGPPDVAVYNFGRAWYFSTQERILFEQLLLAGHVPDVAIFIDGINDFHHPWGFPHASDVLNKAFQGGSTGEAFTNWQMARLARGLQRRLRGTVGSPYYPQYFAEYDNLDILNGVVTRYLRNKELIESIGDGHHIATLFVWQPSPTYKSDDDHYHLFKGEGYGAHTRSRFGYPVMAARQKEMRRSADFLWLADMQQDRKEPLYCDLMHYTNAFAKDIADSITTYLKEHKLVAKHVVGSAENRGHTGG